jgi:hypothetical protein
LADIRNCYCYRCDGVVVTDGDKDGDNADVVWLLVFWRTEFVFYLDLNQYFPHVIVWMVFFTGHPQTTS